VDPCDEGAWPEAIELLLKAGADPFVGNEAGFTPLDMLEERIFEEGEEEEARRLLEETMDP